MNKRIWVLLLVLVLVPLVSGQNAWAGSKQRHRWEGVAIGLGAAFIGSALAHGYWGSYQQAHTGYYAPAHRYVPPPVRVYPQTRIIYHSRETIRTVPPGHFRHRPWGCEKRFRRHGRRW